MDTQSESGLKDGMVWSRLDHTAQSKESGAILTASKHVYFYISCTGKSMISHKNLGVILSSNFLCTEIVVEPPRRNEPISRHGSFSGATRFSSGVVVIPRPFFNIHIRWYLRKQREYC